MLIRPDELLYDFNAYFFYDFTEHEIRILPNLSTEKLIRATKTDEILNFNHKAMIESRRQSYDGFIDKPDYPKDKLKHRFIFK